MDKTLPQTSFEEIDALLKFDQSVFEQGLTDEQLSEIKQDEQQKIVQMLLENAKLSSEQLRQIAVLTDPEQITSLITELLPDFKERLIAITARFKANKIILQLNRLLGEMQQAKDQTSKADLIYTQMLMEMAEQNKWQQFANEQAQLADIIKVHSKNG